MTCEEENCTLPPARGYANCHDHKGTYKGTGKTILCQMCGRPQRVHKLGYPEHAAAASQISGPPTAQQWARILRNG